MRGLGVLGSGGFVKRKSPVQSALMIKALLEMLSCCFLPLTIDWIPARIERVFLEAVHLQIHMRTLSGVAGQECLPFGLLHPHSVFVL